MKKFLCVLLVLMLAMVSGVSLAAANYTLPEKLDKQLSIGSGLKGELVIRGEGTSPVLFALQPFLDVPLQFRSLKNGGEMHAYLYQAGENETQKGLTELYQKAEDFYIRSDLLPGEVYRIPGIEDLADLVTQPGGGNPSLASALIRWLGLSQEERDALLTPITAWMENELEMWVSSYAVVSEVRTLENGTPVIDLNYSIPMADLKKETVSLMEGLIRSEAGQALLGRLLNLEQQQVFMNEHLGYYYLEALEKLQNGYDVQYTRTVTTLGNPVSSELELSLDPAATGYQALVLEDRDGLTSVTLRSDEHLITLLIGALPDWTQIDSMSAWIITRPNSAEKKPEDASLYHAIRVDLAHHSEESADEEGRDHLRENWTLSSQRDVSRLPEGEDAKNYPEEAPQELDVRLHYFSRYSQSSPTTLEAQIVYTGEDLKLQAESSMKSASPWTLTPFSTEGAMDITALSSLELSIKAAEAVAAASEQFVPEKTAEDEPASEETESSEETNIAEETIPEDTTEPEEAVSAEPEAEEAGDHSENEENPEAAEASGNEETEIVSEESDEPVQESPSAEETEAGAAD